MFTTALVNDSVEPRLDTEHRLTGHPERPERVSAILDHLDGAGLRERMLPLSARDATDEELLRVHDERMLDRQLFLTSSGGGMADQDTYLTHASSSAARRAAGAVLVALKAVIDGDADASFAVVRPPGHHATRELMMGFCLLNNVAIAAAAAFEAGLERVAIVDWDVHHGNGTQAIYDSDPRVFYASTHASPFYPGTGAHHETGHGNAMGTKVNVPLPHGAGDEAFVASYEHVIVPALNRFAPDIVLVSCGWDAHIRDGLAPLQVTTAGYTKVARLVIDSAARLCDRRVVAALEGGYDTHALAWCSGALCELLLGDQPTPDPEPQNPPPGPDVTGLLDAVRAAIMLS